MTDAQIAARAAHARQIGSLGGQRTAEMYGTQYMRALGAAGFQVYADRYHGGNRAAARGALMAVKPLSFHGNGHTRSRPAPQPEIDAARLAAAA